MLNVLILGGLFALHREIRRLQRQEVTHNPTPAETQESKVSSQVIHDLNNLLSTMGGFAEAALEDVSKDDPIRTDLKEITDAAERAKDVIKQLSGLVPKSHNNTGSSRSHSAESVKRNTSSYRLPDSRPFERNSSYPPTAKPISEYRRENRPPMATPVPSTSFSSSPSSCPPSMTNDVRRTSTFPVPKISTGEVRRARPFEIQKQLEGGSGDTPLSKKKSGGLNMAARGRPRLLIVDDEIQLLTMFRRFFEPQGYDVITYSDSLEAWDAFREDSGLFDLAILDQRMPEMSGSCLATEMIAIRPDFPIILLTGYSDTVSPADAVRIGIRKYLSKPIPQAELTETIKNILEERAV